MKGNSRFVPDDVLVSRWMKDTFHLSDIMYSDVYDSRQWQNGNATEILTYIYSDRGCAYPRKNIYYFISICTQGILFLFK